MIRAAEGERRAISGYSAQFRTAAMLTLRSLRDDDFQWVRVADPDAGTLDDFQICTSARVDAYQIKYSGTAGSFTYRQLKGMLPELADSWRGLTSTNDGMVVMAHLFTTRLASSHDSVKPVGDPPPCPRHFACFLKDVLRPVQNGEIRRLAEIADEWRPAWDALSDVSSLDGRELFEFIRHFRLNLGQAIPDGRPDDPLLDPTMRADLQAVLWVLEAAVLEHRVTLSRDDLLARLGWSARVALGVHRFPFNDIYRRNTRSARELEAALDRLPGGYVALTGTPGSGKSSLLADVVGPRANVAASYYVYVPSSGDVWTTRARAVPFLNHLVSSIDRVGFRVGQTPNPNDPDALALRFQHQLEMLGKSALAGGSKWLILIDGLDHVNRAMPGMSGDSLLRYLPAEIPDGVLIVLGSQTLQPAPAWVRSALDQDGRTIEVKPLTRPMVDLIASAAGIDDSMYDLVWTKGDGHPLSTTYIIQTLPDADEHHWVYDLTTGGGLDGIHRRYWVDVENDDDLVEMLALIARWRGPIDLEWFAEHGYAAAIRQLKRMAGHFFHQEADDRWLFFHESFQLFLIEQTGSKDGRAAVRYHRRLAEMCAATSPEHPASWERLHHLTRANDAAGVFELATPELVRTQVEALRPLRAIVEDLHATLPTIGQQRDLVALVNLILSTDEATRGELPLWLIDDLLEVIIRLGGVRIAMEHLKDWLDIGSVVFRASALLDAAGEHVEAERLFEHGESSDLLGNSLRRFTDISNSVETLMPWVRAAPRFRKVSEIVTQLLVFTAPTPATESYLQEEISIGRAVLLLTLGRSLVELQEIDEIELVLAAFEEDDEYHRSFRLMLEIEASRHGAGVADARILISTLSNRDPARYRHAARVLAAESLLAAGELERARTWIASVPQQLVQEMLSIGTAPTLVPRVLNLAEHNQPQETELTPNLLEIGLSRVLAAIADVEGSARSLSYWDLLEEPDEIDKENRLIASAVVSIAQMWGRTDGGARVLPAELDAVFDRIEDDSESMRRGWHEGESNYVNALPELFTLLIRVAALNGREALTTVQQRLRAHWGNVRQGSSHEMATVLASMVDLDIDRTWARDQLKTLEVTLLEDCMSPYAISDRLVMVKIWWELGDRRRAQESLRKIMRESFTLVGGHSESQREFAGLLKLIRPLLTEPAAESDEMVLWLAQCTMVVCNMYPFSAMETTRALLRTIAPTHPGRMLPLSRWLAIVTKLEEEKILAVMDEVVGNDSESQSPRRSEWLVNLQTLAATAPEDAHASFWERLGEGPDNLSPQDVGESLDDVMDLLGATDDERLRVARMAVESVKHLIGDLLLTDQFNVRAPLKSAAPMTRDSAA
jgi:hypothetical protein